MPKLNPYPPLPRWLWFHVGRNNAYYEPRHCWPPIGVGIWGPLLYRIGYFVGMIAGPADKRP